MDANGVLIYYAEFGHGSPLVVLHGGPGASHDYLLPWLLPLARSLTAACSPKPTLSSISST